MLSEKTKKANAALMGLGRTRRIVISDTLLAACNHDEIEAVLTHELGHHVHHHMLKAIAVQGVVTFVGFWVPETYDSLGRAGLPLRFLLIASQILQTLFV